MVLRKSSGTLAAVAALAGQAHGELAGEGLQRLAQHHHLLAGGVHEVDVLGQRLAQRAGHGLHTPVGHEAPADLGLDLLLQLLDAGLELVALEALLELGERLGALLAGLLHELLEQVVEIEVPQRAVQVVGAADRAARLHAGEALHRLAGDGAHHAGVALLQRLHQHLGDLLGRHGVHGATATRLVAVLALVALELVHELVDRLGQLAVRVELVLADPGS